MIPKLALPAILCLATAVSACVLRPYPGALTEEERYSFYLANRDDPEHAALATARAEIADRRAAVELLRELANRYRIAGREKTLAALDHSPREPAAASSNVVSAQLRAAAPPESASQFAELVERCTQTVGASAGKPTYNPKLFDWLCRASVLPEANNRKADNSAAEDERTANLAVAIERLMSFAERCKGTSSAHCGDADKLIAQLINQQPVAPVPQRLLGKIAIERPSERPGAPGPTASAAPSTQPNATELESGGAHGVGVIERAVTVPVTGGGPDRLEDISARPSNRLIQR